LRFYVTFHGWIAMGRAGDDGLGGLDESLTLRYPISQLSTIVHGQLNAFRLHQETPTMIAKDRTLHPFDRTFGTLNWYIQLLPVRAVSLAG
jgi:hypothetical protein